MYVLGIQYRSLVMINDRIHKTLWCGRNLGYTCTTASLQSIPTSPIKQLIIQCLHHNTLYRLQRPCLPYLSSCQRPILFAHLWSRFFFFLSIWEGERENAIFRDHFWMAVEPRFLGWPITCQLCYVNNAWWINSVDSQGKSHFLEARHSYMMQ